MFMYIVVLSFLLLSLLLYALLGGADFGAGVIQLLSTTPKAEKVIGRAIGPIWEANHMWLVIAVVISFMGFPAIFKVVSTALHIPIFILLLGIIFRGTAYAFKHYDAIKDEKSQLMYQRVFVWGSLVSTLFIGITFGAMSLGKIDPNATDFYTGYIAPWFNFFSISVGFLATALFAFLAAVYLIGENEDPEVKEFFIAKAWKWLLASVAIGVVVFVAAYVDGLPLFNELISSPLSIVAIALASILLPFLFKTIRQGKVVLARLMAGAQTVLILGAWLLVHYPHAIMLSNGGSLDLYDSRAPDATLSVLGWALMLGSLFILPALGYLYVVFKGYGPEETI